MLGGSCFLLLFPELHVTLVLLVLNVRVDAEAHAQVVAMGPAAHVDVAVAASAVFELLDEDQAHLRVYLALETESLECVDHLVSLLIFSGVGHHHGGVKRSRFSRKVRVERLAVGAQARREFLRLLRDLLVGQFTTIGFQADAVELDVLAIHSIVLLVLSLTIVVVLPVLLIINHFYNSLRV